MFSHSQVVGAVKWSFLVMKLEERWWSNFKISCMQPCTCFLLLGWGERKSLIDMILALAECNK